MNEKSNESTKGGTMQNHSMQTQDAVPYLLGSREAAKVLAVSERTLWGITSPRGELPAVYIGRAVRYDPNDLLAFIERQKGVGHE